ncbi:MAG: hypothetical protein QM724_11535 [Flavobacteriales bacterium]
MPATRAPHPFTGLLALALLLTACGGNTATEVPPMAPPDTTVTAMLVKDPHSFARPDEAVDHPPGP